ncbi:hypothetical protein DAPPUDRAFT_117630 [Daphnia pulex]|uniref:ATPase AAA-type core domain-containing protein n=1 Tax=Daphnia pulex TaxID=6669 RepID=E9HTB1_DAPPU|nr:hypothetical protein DAPPUDRAFT_117630 [Daphnia pulex]|eukprot:EFX65026.1 hypothetical protein DAPPUDRAFT_117630 [Daphnia pulex]
MSHEDPGDVTYSEIGTGKTLLARAVASQLDANFLKVDAVSAKTVKKFGNVFGFDALVRMRAAGWRSARKVARCPRISPPDHCSATPKSESLVSTLADKKEKEKQKKKKKISTPRPIPALMNHERITRQFNPQRSIVESELESRRRAQVLGGSGSEWGRPTAVKGSSKLFGTTPKATAGLTKKKDGEEEVGLTSIGIMMAHTCKPLFPSYWI